MLNTGEFSCVSISRQEKRGGGRKRHPEQKRASPVERINQSADRLGETHGRNPSSRVMRSPGFIGARGQVKSESRFPVLYSQGQARRIRAKALQTASLRIYVTGGAALLPRVLCLVSSHSYCWNASVREGARAPTRTTKRKPSTGEQLMHCRRPPRRGGGRIPPGEATAAVDQPQCVQA